MMRHLLAVLVLVTFAVPAAAQEPSPEHLEAAAALLEVMDTEASMRKTVDALTAMQIEQNPQLAEVEDIMRDVLSRALDWSALEDEFARMYADLYTMEELRELRTFYRTPLGQRVVATMPALSIRTQQITDARMQEFMPELQRRIMQRMMEGDGGGGSGGGGSLDGG